MSESECESECEPETPRLRFSSFSWSKRRRRLAERAASTRMHVIQATGEPAAPGQSQSVAGPHLSDSARTRTRSCGELQAKLKTKTSQEEERSSTTKNKTKSDTGRRGRRRRRPRFCDELQSFVPLLLLPLIIAIALAPTSNFKLALALKHPKATPTTATASLHPQNGSAPSSVVTTQEALLGETLDLECGLAPPPALALESAAGAAGTANGEQITWMRFDQGTAQMISYSNRMLDYFSDRYTLIGPGNSSLRIKSVELADNATFSCVAGSEEKVTEVSVFKVPRKLHLLAFEQRDQHQPNHNANANANANSKNSMQQVQLTLGATLDDDSSSAAAPAPQKLTVLLNTRLKLQCNSDEAAPRAELTWQDSNGNDLSGSSPEEPTQGQGNSSSSDGYEFEQLSWPASPANKFGPSAPPQHSSSSLKFQVGHQHDKAHFTCLARHPAFQRPDRWPHLLGRQPAKSVQLEVIYAPEIILSPAATMTAAGEQLRASLFEGEPFAYKCELIRAYPEEVSFQWFIDEELVVNATEPLLSIEAMPRYLRSIKCQASNSAGSTSAQTRPDIHYGPAYVGHLLLPPQATSQHPQATNNNYRFIGGSGQQSTASAIRRNSLVATNNARANQEHEQLAIGFDLGESFNISCAFDSNPRLGERVSWFKMATSYADMIEVMPSEAGELIERGLAQFALSGSRSPSGGRVPLVDYEAMSEHWNAEIERHEQLIEQQQLMAKAAASISTNAPVAAPSISDQSHQQQQPADQMAIATAANQMPIMDELPNGSGPESWLNLSLPQEQLTWIYEVESKLRTEPNYTNYLPFDGANNTIETSAGKLVFISKQQHHHPAKPHQQQHHQRKFLQKSTTFSESGSFQNQNQSSSTGGPVKKRPALVTISKYELKQANEDSMGHYVCHASLRDNNDSNIVRKASRSIYLVARKKPRIVSMSNQFALLGSREIRVDCLIQVNTVDTSSHSAAGNPNATNSVTWFKDNKPFVVQHERISSDSNQVQKFVLWSASPAFEPSGRQAASKNITLLEQYSPDFLFLRSQLKIEGADLTDFGHYTCAINNSLGADSLNINFQYRTQTAFYLDAMAALSIGMGVIFFSIVCFLIVYGPRAAYFGPLLAGSSNERCKSSGKHDSHVKRANATVVLATPPRTTLTDPDHKQKQKDQQCNLHGATMAHSGDDKSSSGNSSASPMDELDAANGHCSPDNIANQTTRASPSDARQDTKVDVVNSAGLLQRICARFGMQNAAHLQGQTGSKTSLVPNSPGTCKPSISLPLSATLQANGQSKEDNISMNLVNQRNQMMLASGINLFKIQQLSQQQHQVDSGAGSDATTATTANGTNESSRSSSSASPTNNNNQNFRQVQMMLMAKQQQQQQQQQHQLQMEQSACIYQPAINTITNYYHQSGAGPQAHAIQTVAWPLNQSYNNLHQQATIYDTIYATNCATSNSNIAQNNNNMSQYSAPNPNANTSPSQQHGPMVSMGQLNYSPPVPAKPAIISSSGIALTGAGQALNLSQWPLRTTMITNELAQSPYHQHQHQHQQHLTHHLNHQNQSGTIYSTLQRNQNEPAPANQQQTSPTASSLLRQAYPTMSPGAPAASSPNYQTLPATPSLNSYANHAPFVTQPCHIDSSHSNNDSNYSTNSMPSAESTSSSYGHHCFVPSDLVGPATTHKSSTLI